MMNATTCFCAIGCGLTHATARLVTVWRALARTSTRASELAAYTDPSSAGAGLVRAVLPSAVGGELARAILPSSAGRVLARVATRASELAAYIGVCGVSMLAAYTDPSAVGGELARAAFLLPAGDRPMRRTRLRALLAAVVLTAAAGEAARAQPTPPVGVGFEQRIGERLPVGVTFTDTSGTQRRLGDFFSGQPVVLYFGYARCPQLCSVVADGTNDVLRRLERSVGRDYRVVTISLDPQEPPAEARSAEALAVRRYGRSGASAGWHYLTGPEPAIQAVAAAAGFHYRFDAASRQFAHPSGFLIATPDGTISRYFLGVDFDAREVGVALAQAADGRTGGTVFDLLLLCFRGENGSGRYTAVIWRVLGMAVTATVAALFGGIGWMLYQERRRAALGRGRP